MTPNGDGNVMDAVAPRGPSFLQGLVDAVGDDEEKATVTAEPEAESQPTEGEPSDAPDADSLPDADAPTAETESQSEAEDEDDPESSTAPAPDATASAESQPDDVVARFRAIAEREGKPFAYQVSGESRTFDGIVDLGEKGAYIPPDALNTLRSQLSLGQKSIDDNRDLYRLRQEFEKLGGFEKMESLTRDLHRVDAAGAILLNLLDNPQELATLLQVDAHGNVTGINVRQRDFVLRQLDVAAKEAEFKAREDWQASRTGFQQEQTLGQEREAALSTAIDRLGDGLTAEDKAAARAFFAPFADKLFRPATQEDVLKHPEQNFRVGQLLLDVPLMQQWFEDRKAIRGTATQAVAKKAAAAKDNAARTQAKATAPAQKAEQPRKPNGQFKKPKGGKPSETPKRDRYDLLRMALRGESLADA